MLKEWKFTWKPIARGSAKTLQDFVYEFVGPVILKWLRAARRGLGVRWGITSWFTFTADCHNSGTTIVRMRAWIRIQTEHLPTCQRLLWSTCQHCQIPEKPQPATIVQAARAKLFSLETFRLVPRFHYVTNDRLNDWWHVKKTWSLMFVGLTSINLSPLTGFQG